MEGEEEKEMDFESVEEEAAYWKTEYDTLKLALKGCQDELEDFETISKAIEGELEADVKRLQQEKGSLEERLHRLEFEVDTWKHKYTSSEKLSNDNASSLQRAIDNLTKENTSAKKAVVSLEQGNDDLERETRNAHSSFLDMESKYNRLMEEKILMEEELIAKDQLQEELQRLRDEVRDQDMEIDILRSRLSSMISEQKTTPTATPTRPGNSETNVINELSTPTANDQNIPRASFMSPVQEVSLEIPPSSPPFPHMVSPAPLGVPSLPVPRTSPKIPLPRHRRLDSLADSSPPASPLMTRSVTVDSLSRSPSKKNIKPPYGMAPSRLPNSSISASQNALSRSTTSRDIAGLAGTPSPRKSLVRSTNAGGLKTSGSMANMVANMNKPVYKALTVAELGKGSAPTREMYGISSRAQRLAGRLNAISSGTGKALTASTRVVSRKASGSFSRAVNAVQPAARDRQTGLMATPAHINMGDVTTHSNDSPGNWVFVAERNQLPVSSRGSQSEATEREWLQDTDMTAGPTEGELVGDVGETALRTLRSTGSHRTLPTRPGIPSPLVSRSVIAQAGALSENIEHSASHTPSVTTSSSLSDGNRLITPSVESRLPILVASNRPSSRASHYDPTETVAKARTEPSRHRVASSASGIMFPSDGIYPSTRRIQPPRPSSRAEGSIRPRSPPIPPVGVSAVGRSSQRAMTPSSFGMEADTPSKRNNVQGTLDSSTSTRPNRRISMGRPSAGGIAGNAGVAGGPPVARSGLPRRSTGGRPMSMQELPKEASPPPVPIVQAKYLDKGNRLDRMENREIMSPRRR